MNALFLMNRPPKRRRFFPRVLRKPNTLSRRALRNIAIIRALVEKSCPLEAMMIPPSPIESGRGAIGLDRVAPRLSEGFVWICVAASRFPVSALRL
jgi:hypothetical protein